MGSGKGRSRRVAAAVAEPEGARARWERTLPQSFPVTAIGEEIFEKEATLQRLVALSSAINSRVLSTRLHNSDEQARAGFGFVDGHTVVTHEYSNSCDCENSRTEKDRDDGSVQEMVCAHSMGVIGASLLEHAERYEKRQGGLQLLAQLAQAEDDAEVARLHGELYAAIADTVAKKPGTVRKVIGSAQGAGGHYYGARNEPPHLSRLLALARQDKTTGSARSEDWSTLIADQDRRKGEVIPIEDKHIRRELKTTMYHDSSKPLYRGFSPVITPALLQEQGIDFYRKPNGDGLLIVNFPGKGETVYAELDAENAELRVGSIGEVSENLEAYVAFLYPLMHDATAQLHDGKALADDLKALNHFPAEFHDREMSRTMADREGTRMRALGTFTGAIFRSAVRAELTGQIKTWTRLRGNHGALLQRWRSDYSPPQPVTPDVIAAPITF